MLQTKLFWKSAGLLGLKIFFILDLIILKEYTKIEMERFMKDDIISIYF